MDRPKTLGELRASGYAVVDVKTEMRRNLIRKLQSGEAIFPGILGYDDTVIPQVQNAILARHDFLMLGLRGQAKTRLLRSLVSLLDDAIPIVAGSDVNDNPFAPISREARDRVECEGDSAAIEWIGRERRYHEKLATPDVTIADLIGEIDMVKHAQGRFLSDELTIHFGLIPRTNRGIFCINELPDLSPKVQVGLFNVLEERDVQIRGFPIRLDLDVCLVFSANPEDYTNRGRIVTPLKDRIGSVIRTHYPQTRELGMAVTEANAWLDRDGPRVVIPRFMHEVVEELARLARASTAVNQQSGVSVRMSIANVEAMVSNAERRGLRQGVSEIAPRISDLACLAASSRGKLELTMSDDDGTEDRVIERLLAEAVKNIFESHFDAKSFKPMLERFESGYAFPAGDAIADADYVARLAELPMLQSQATKLLVAQGLNENSPCLQASAAEFILEGLHVSNRLNKNRKAGQVAYKR